MLGFIEELVVNDDPEHQWIEKIRTPRASNEARQRLFSKLSGMMTDTDFFSSFLWHELRIKLQERLGRYKIKS